MSNSVAESHKRLISNACLYRDLTHRAQTYQPPFLKRNLDQALDHHDRLLLSALHPGPDDAAYDEAAMNSMTKRRRVDWEYPTEGIITRLARRQGPSGLKIESLQIRKLESTASRPARVLSGGVKRDPEISWLPDPDVDLRVPCHVRIHVQDVRAPARTVLKLSEPARIHGRHDEQGHPYFDVELLETISIADHKLFVPVESKSEDEYHWKRDLAGRYNLEISIQCEDADDATRFMQKFEKSKSLAFDRNPHHSVLKASWADLPDCPADGHLLPLTRMRGDLALNLGFGIDVCMEWEHGKKTPLLATYNKQCQAPPPAHLPTPNSSDDLEHANKHYEIRYSYQEGLQNTAFSASDLKCIWCRKPSSSIRRLYVHYTLHHGHFNFQMEMNGEESASILIQMGERISNLSGAPVSDDPEVRHYWQAPDRPFNVDDYIKGDESWTNPTSTSKPPAKRAKTGRGHHSNAHKDPSPHLSATAGPAKAKTSIDDVLDLPPVPRKMIVLPVIPGQVFYHSSSKQPIRPGEKLKPTCTFYNTSTRERASDIRLRHAQRAEFADYGIVGSAQAFHEAFNKYVDVENVESQVFALDAVVRFARKFEGVLGREEEWRSEFERKLGVLEFHCVLEGRGVRELRERYLLPSAEHMVA